MAVDLAVEDEREVVVAGAHGLSSGTRVDDLQPVCAQREGLILPDALLVRPAMGDGRDGFLNSFWRKRTFNMGKASDSTHSLVALF